MQYTASLIDQPADHSLHNTGCIASPARNTSSAVEGVVRSVRLVYSYSTVSYDNHNVM